LSPWRWGRQCWLAAGTDHRQLEDYARKKQQGHNQYFDDMNEILLSEASRIAHETGREITIKTGYVTYVGSPETPVRRRKR
jgi:hypothetical protein